MSKVTSKGKRVSGSWLVDSGIVRKDNKSSALYEQIVPKCEIKRGLSPHKFISNVWPRLTGSDRNSNGSFFEYAIATCLLGFGISPFYVQANLLHIDGVAFDFVLYRDGLVPIVISAKTSLRERWKQAELEGRILKQVYTKAECYLVTMDVDAQKLVQRKVIDREAVGIDKVVLANSSDFSNLIMQLQAHQYSEAISVEPVTNPKIVSL